ncbi:MAG: sensor histidine kinase N-terminal domain-containing protein [Burkholderiales bacterium]|nr:sensor histidine kinase N-terminal domain-containing protein [Burkholderiales bacterium]
MPRNTEQPSLRRRIGLAVAATAILVWLLGAVVTVWIAWQETGEVLDGQLEQTARFIATLPTEEFEEYDHQLTPPRRAQSRYEPVLGFQVWSREGRLLFASPDVAPAPHPGTGALNVTRDVGAGGATWRAHALAADRTGHVIQVQERRQPAAHFVAHVAETFARSALVFIPLVAVLAGLAVRHVLRPIDRLRGEVAARGPHTEAPIQRAGVPQEMTGLVESINDLAARHARLLGTVRRFSEDAAHEMRTPLAAIRAHAQAALGDTDDDWLRGPLAQIMAESTRLAALLDQLLLLGQLDHGDHEFPFEPCDVGALARSAVAGARDVELVAPPAGPQMRCAPLLVRAALENLLANARKHGGGRLRVEVLPDATGATLAVEDDGAGVAAAEREAVFAPFYRGAGARASGSGLGLSIVARIAALHGGRAWVEPARTLAGARFVVALR